jgi:hypothetical protein
MANIPTKHIQRKLIVYAIFPKSQIRAAAGAFNTACTFEFDFAAGAFEFKFGFEAR